MRASSRTPASRPPAGRRLLVHLALLSLLVASSGCSLRTYAINMVGDALASGDSVYETDDDIELVGAALPFGLKLTESLLAQSPDHPGLLLTACRGFTMYSYAFVAYEAELLNEVDLDRARAMRRRARKLYLRGAHYGFHALERNYPGLEQALMTDPAAAAAKFGPRNATRDVPLMYWTAAALGLAISASIDDAALLARLPEVEALLDRALALDEAWDEGALHEFKVIVAGGRPGRSGDKSAIDAHYTRALELSKGASAGLFVAYAEAVSLPAQNKAEFRTMLERAMAVDPDRQPRDRLATLVSQRRARWLLGRIDDLILSDDRSTMSGGMQWSGRGVSR
jgi:predicted anti-sigma-YlaC factor YlaD